MGEGIGVRGRVRGKEGGAKSHNERMPAKANSATVAFQLASTTCASDLTAYARCVVKHHTDSSLSKGCCQREFTALRSCFEQCRRVVRKGGR